MQVIITWQNKIAIMQLKNDKHSAETFHILVINHFIISFVNYNQKYPSEEFHPGAICMSWLVCQDSGHEPRHPIITVYRLVFVDLHSSCSIQMQVKHMH